MGCFVHRFCNTHIVLVLVVLGTSKRGCFGHVFRPLEIHTPCVVLGIVFTTHIFLCFELFWVRLRGVVFGMYFAHFGFTHHLLFLTSFLQHNDCIVLGCFVHV